MDLEEKMRDEESATEEEEKLVAEGAGSLGAEGAIKPRLSKQVFLVFLWAIPFLQYQVLQGLPLLGQHLSDCGSTSEFESSSITTSLFTFESGVRDSSTEGPSLVQSSLSTGALGEASRASS